MPATVPESGGHGAPRKLWALLERNPPPGVPAAGRWHSPLRGPWLTAVLGSVLLAGLPVVSLTGLLSWVAYGPQFGQAIPADPGWLHLPVFAWPTRPAWLFQLNQGLHVGLGLALIPVVLAKLWSVAPRLFVWPPARSIAGVGERLSLALLVGGVLFELVTGVMNIQYDYAFGFSFYTAHYYGAWVFLAGFAVHVAIKLPTLVAALRSRSVREELRTPLSRTEPEPPEPGGLAPPAPTAPTLSRRGALAVVGGGSLLLGGLALGQTVDALRPTALLAPRGRSYGEGPGDFQVNRTAEAAGVDPGPDWRLTLTGGSTVVGLDRAELLALPQHSAVLPIACVEGWSTTQEWSGVRLRDLTALAGVAAPASAFLQSLERRGAFNSAVLAPNQILDPDSLLALRVNGVDLPLDHGFPARVIVPALPGVHNTKWIRSIDFRSSR